MQSIIGQLKIIKVFLFFALVQKYARRFKRVHTITFSGNLFFNIMSDDF